MNLFNRKKEISMPQSNSILIADDERGKMKRLFVIVFGICLLCFTLVACGEEKSNPVTDMVKNLSAIKGDSYQAGRFKISEDYGEIYHSAAILRHEKEEIGTVTVIEKEGEFGGAVIKSDFLGLYPEAFAVQILSDIGFSKENIEVIKNDIIYGTELEQLRSLDLNGYRIMGVTIIEEETQETVFELNILNSSNIKDYKEGEFQSLSLTE
jgi:hypothetical protein